MRKQLRRDGRCLEYELTRKRIKNINLRVRFDGSVAVSAPQAVPQAAVEAFLLERWNWIDQARRKTAQHPPAFAWGEGAVFHLLGEALTLALWQGEGKEVRREGNRVVLTMARPHSAAAGLSLLESWYLERANEALEEARRAVWPQFAALRAKPPAIRLRWMTARWGSCRARTGEITLNKRLFALAPPCLEYVLLHECAHLFHPNHGPGFRGLVASLLPGWREREGLLKRESASAIFLK